MKKLFFFIILISFKAFSFEFSNLSFDHFFSSLKLEDLSVRPIEFYFKNDNIQELKKYEENLFKIHTRILEKTLNNLINLNSCKDDLKVDIGLKFKLLDHEKIKSFESELIQIKSIKCLGKINLNKAFEVFHSDNFMLSANKSLVFSETKSIENTLCQVTNKFPIGDSEYCVKYDMWKNENIYLSISHNTWSNQSRNAPVYLRFFSTSFVRLNNEQVIMINITHGRGPELPFQSFVKKIVESEQASYIQKFIDTIK